MATIKKTGPTLQVLADQIHAHLRRFENDPVINAPVSLRRPYYRSGAEFRGSYVEVHYCSYGFKGDMLRKDMALAYLTWLDAGNVGTHHQMLKEKKN